MPRMTRWNNPEPIDVPAAKAAVYAAQGWVSVTGKPAKVQPAIVRPAPETVEGPVDEPAPKPVKKAASKKAASKKP